MDTGVFSINNAHTDAYDMPPTCTVSLEDTTAGSQDTRISHFGILLIIDCLLPEELVVSSGHRWLQEQPPAPDRPSEIGRFSPARKDIPRSTQAENTPQFLCV